jgi:lipopolysaccharide transport system permease protein
MSSTFVAARDWTQSAETLGLLVMKDLRVRYKSSFLGYLWALANPLAFTVVYYFAFQVIMRVQIENYGVYLVTGLFPWTWMAASLIQSASSYRANRGLVRKVKIEPAILPLSSTVHEMVHFFFALPVLLGAILVTGGTWHVSWLALIPVMVLVQFSMIYPIGLMLAIANVFVRDVEYLIGIVLQMLFFLTPIVYSSSAAPPGYERVLVWNPFASMIEAWRVLFYEGRLSPEAVSRCVIFAAVAAVVGWPIHRALHARIGERL